MKRIWLGSEGVTDNERNSMTTPVLFWKVGIFDVDDLAAGPLAQQESFAQVEGVVNHEQFDTAVNEALGLLLDHCGLTTPGVSKETLNKIFGTDDAA